MTQCIAYARSSRNIYIKNFTYFYVYAIEHVLLLPYMHFKKYREKKSVLFSKIRNFSLKMSILREKVPNFGDKDRFFLTIFPSVEVWLDARIDDQLCAGF